MLSRQLDKHLGDGDDSSPIVNHFSSSSSPDLSFAAKSVLHDEMADLKTCPPLTRESVFTAHTRIKPHIHHTPTLTNTTISNLASTPQTADALNGTEWEGQQPAKPKIRVLFKCENYQRIGAFKARGAFHALGRLIEEEGEEEVRRRGVVTHSSGESVRSVQVLLCFLVSQ